MQLFRATAFSLTEMYHILFYRNTADMDFPYANKKYYGTTVFFFNSTMVILVNTWHGSVFPYDNLTW